MMNNPVEKIEAYFSGEMTSEEQKSFEQELTTNTPLARLFDTYRTIETHMSTTENGTSETTLKIALTKLSDEFFKTESKTDTEILQKETLKVNKPISSPTSAKRSFRRINLAVWQIAAAILFGIALVGTWYVLTKKQNPKEQVVVTPTIIPDSTDKPRNSIDALSQTPPSLVQKDTGSNVKLNTKVPEKVSNEQLFTRYFKPDAAPKDQEDPLEEAFDKYEKRQYANAATAFDNIDLNYYTRGSTTDTLLIKFYASYYKALSYMAIGKSVKAVVLLKDLISLDSSLEVKVQWFLALAYLRTGKTREVIPLLEAITRNNGAGQYKIQAYHLLTELSNRKEASGL